LFDSAPESNNARQSPGNESQPVELRAFGSLEISAGHRWNCYAPMSPSVPPSCGCEAMNG